MVEVGRRWSVARGLVGEVRASKLIQAKWRNPHTAVTKSAATKGLMTT